MDCYTLTLKNKVYIDYNLQFFAQDGEGGEKTEEPTSKKLDDARKQGQVAKSKELTSGLQLVLLFVLLKVYVGTLGTRFINIFQWIYENRLPDFVMEANKDMTATQVSGLLFYVMLQILICVAPFFIGGFAVAFVGDMVQVKWKISTEPMKPKLSKFNPINGFKRMFSKESLFNLGLSIVKIVLIFYIAYTSIKDQANDLFILYNITLNQAISLIGDIIINTGLKISIIYLILGFVDYFYQRHKFHEDMKMTKQEVKDEYKQTEGDPKVKGQQRQRMQEASRRRMMESVPKADVVITNPTHLAIAIRYDAENATAPVVIAKGADYLAQRIKEIAKDNDVPIIENKPLARAIYTTVDVDQEIPPELYEAVAEILALVYTARR